MVRTSRRRGFTMIELIVSFSILMIVFVLVLPGYNRLRSDQMNNAVAQELANDLRRAASEALQGETYTVVEFKNAQGNASTQAWRVSKITHTPAGGWSYTPNTWQVMKVRDFSSDMGRTFLSTSGSKIGFGPKGWTTLGTDDSNVQCTGLTAITNSLGNYYQITCSSGAGIPTYSVRVFVTGGRVNVVSP